MFTEKEFLLGNEEALRLASSQKDNETKEFLDRFQQKYFKNEIELYNLFLNEVAKLFIRLNLDNPFDYSIILSWLIQDGYLSYKREFKKKRRFEISIQHGINIVNGNGICRHFTAFHADIFKLLGLYFEKYYCYLGDMNFKTNDANHVLGIIDYNSTLYGIDLYNGNDVYYFKSGFELCKISNLLQVILRYKPCSDYMITDKSYKDILDSIERYEQESKKSHISLLELIKLRRHASKVYHKSMELFELFHSETEELKRDITSGVRSKALTLARMYDVRVKNNYLDF